jgi:hypothetical protein
MPQHRTTIRSLILTAAVLPLALSAACGSRANTGTSTTSAPSHAAQASPVLVGGQCPASATDPAVVKLSAEPAEVALPGDFHAIAAVRCVTEQRMVPGHGQWQFAEAQRADSNLAGFLTALKLRSQTSPGGSRISCTAIGLALPPFALVDASGTVVRPRLPHDACGIPLPRVLTTLAALPWRTETEERLNQLQTQPEIDTGCAPAYKDMFELPVSGTPVPSGLVRGPSNPEPNTVCAYSVVPTTGTVTEGQFTKGLRLNAAQRAHVITALNQATNTTAPACATPATRIATITGPGADIAVELDGCHRLRFPNGFTDAAPAPLLQALAALGIA